VEKIQNVISYVHTTKQHHYGEQLRIRENTDYDNKVCEVEKKLSELNLDINRNTYKRWYNHK
jgi:hypothetical protein